MCGISSPSLAGVLVRMEELGFVTRERMDHDQRRLLVSLTPKSRGLAARMAPQVEAAYAELEGLLGAPLSAARCTRYSMSWSRRSSPQGDDGAGA